MSIERQYVRQLNESIQKQQQLNEESGYKYAYTTRERSDAEKGWIVADSIEELHREWNLDPYGSLVARKVLVMKPATSVDNALVLFSDSGRLEGYQIYPSIDAVINGPAGLKEMGWEAGESSGITEEDVQELLQTRDLNRAKEILKNIADEGELLDGDFWDLYQYVSGYMPADNSIDPERVPIPSRIDLPKQKKDSNFYLNQIKRDPDRLEKVPLKFRTPELCKIAVQQSAYALKEVPEKLKTPELCKIAVENGGYALEYVPDELKTPELCKIAIEDRISNIEYVPDELKTPELCKLAVEKEGSYLAYVPDNLKTPELCRIAVEKDGPALEYVPDELKTPELCKIAIKEWRANLAFVPDKLKTPEFCKTAVEVNGRNLAFVPDKLKTSELCQLALKDSGYHLKYVPERLKTPELCKIAVEDDGAALKFVPAKLKTLELCKIAVKQTGFALNFVPDHLKEQVKQELGMK